MAKCEHDRERTKCKECADAGTGGGSICEHHRVRQSCSVCSPEQVFRQYQFKAKQRGLSFSLTLADFEKFVAAPCQYCGENLDPRGVDRKDSRIGYVIWNCQTLCWPCNQLKSCGRHPGQPENEQQFLAQVQKIARHQEKLRKQKTAPGTGHIGQIPASISEEVSNGTN